ncbi:hypothetical protein A1O3_04916 [Capronia epimyces CBS 606.96]|uniref:Uncharacterized protein n=1 Tax=Capronia epimyces CBS 606.96 TaxID=1182542 RepID=W9YPR1_9EURO|nr:uncharacterized protein A1O3_04916 [Capronia epimyces CBS 606.96]EXJ84249.1 hypothetical protein A1O3_04916 [Capronia epimyces CBS 606.96]
MTSSRLADLFEEFCRPPSSTSFPLLGATTNTHQTVAHHQQQQPNGGDGGGMAQLPGHFMPFEEITLPPHLMPLNPEDEDDVVPDMHAAFGINRALGQGQAGGPGAVGGVGGSGGATGSAEPGGEASNAGVQREPVWRDFGLGPLVADVRPNGIGERPGPRREGRRTGVLLLR